MALEIKTNHQERELLSLHELPLGRQSQVQDDFDWLSADEFDYGFFTYKGRVHHISEYMRIENHPDADFSSWHGYEADSYFSGTVVRLSDDGETVVVGSYCS